MAGLAVRYGVVSALHQVLTRGRALDEALPAGLPHGLEPRDRALAHALAILSLRHYGQIRFLLDQRLDRGLPNKSGMLEAILISGVVQILLMDVPAHAAVDLAVRLARLSPHSAGYAALVNGILRGIERDRPALPAASLALPAWLLRRWRKTYGAQTMEAMAAALLMEPPLDLSVRENPDHWAQVLGATRLPSGTLRLNKNSEHTKSSGAVPLMAGFEEGAWWAQDAGAFLPVLVMGDVCGANVLDMCAAPGGKTLALCVRGAQVTALDRSPQRMQRVSENLTRMKMTAQTVVADATQWTDSRLFDAVLLDAPCSSTGTLRRHPDVGLLKSDADVASLARLQTKLLDRAALAVRVGGRLVYSTCSLEPEEGEEQIRAFLARHKGYRLDAVAATEIGGYDEMITPQGWVRSLPQYLADFGGIDGFFVARLIRDS